MGALLKAGAGRPILSSLTIVLECTLYIMDDDKDLDEEEVEDPKDPDLDDDDDDDDSDEFAGMDE